MAAVDLEILLLPAMSEPYRANNPHGEGVESSICATSLAHVNRAWSWFAGIAAQSTESGPCLTEKHLTRISLEEYRLNHFISVERISSVASSSR